MVVRMEGFGGPARPSSASANARRAITVGLKCNAAPVEETRAMGRQLGFVCAWRCRAQGAPDWNLRPPPSGVLLGGLSFPELGPFP
jgi:hypothetical protein